MSLESYKITDAAIATKGVVAAPDKLTGTASQNKAVFDRLIREAVKGLFNGLIDAIAGTGGAGEIGTTAIEGVTGTDVQTVLGSLKTILDTKSASADMTAALSLKSDKSVTDLHFKAVSLNAATGIFTFTREDGSYVTIDTVLEKVATNWQYDADTQSLVLTLADGTTQSVPLSAFITETEFVDSDQIDFSVNNHTVTATVKAGSITDTMLASALVEQLEGYVSAAAGSAGDALQYKNAAEGYKNTASQKATAADVSATEAESYAKGGTSSRTGEDTDNAKYYKEQAALSQTAADASATEAESYAKGGTSSRTGEDTDNAKYFKEHAALSAAAASSSATAADGSAEDAEAWAAGKRNGADVGSTDPAYHNNAKYYSEQASGSASGASSSATAADASATEAESYARGGTSSRTGEDTDNAKYYKEQAALSASGASSSAGAASGSATAADASATEAESYAKGGTSSRTGEDTDNAKYFKEHAALSAAAASSSATAADGSAEDAEAWAVGKRNGVDVGSTDPAYHNNAKYYKEQAAGIVGGDYALRSELADKETTTTASRAYAVGEYLVCNDTFYRVTAPIAQGGTITPGTNCTQVKLGNDLAGKQNSIKTASVSLTTTWSGNDPFTQTVSVTGATANSKIDLQPTAAQLAQLLTDEVTALYVENNNGTLTAYALGAAPTVAMTIQCTMTEVST